MGKYITDEIIDEIRRKADIVEIAGAFTTVSKRGTDYWACCPFHQEKTPSFKLNQERQVFYCFGCKKSGNLFKLVQEMVNTDFPGAVEWLANRLSIIIPEGRKNPGEDSGEAARRRTMREEGRRLLQEAAAFFQQCLQQPEGAAARQYLQERGLDWETVEKFRLGYAPDSWDALGNYAFHKGFSQELLVHTGLSVRKEERQDRCYDRFRGRLMFPICDELGRVVGFSGRVLQKSEQAAKYVNSPESEFFQKGSLLYGLYLARNEFKEKGHALVCEGQMDVIACHRAGLKQAVAAQGTAFTAQHAALLKRSTACVRLAFDGDLAGVKATLRTIDLLLAADLQVSVVILPEHEDPDSIFRTGGPEALQQIMAVAEEAVPFIYRMACQEHDQGLPEGKSAIVSQTLHSISALPDQIARTAHCQWLAAQLHLPENILLDSLNGHLRKRQQAELRQDVHAHPGAPRASQSVPPPFSLPLPVVTDVQVPILANILDLILHFEFLAERMLQSKALHLLPDTPLGQAVNIVLAACDQGEWSLAGQSLAESDLVNNPEVGQVLAQSNYRNLMPDSGSPEQKNDKLTALQRALSDCENRLLLVEVTEQLRQLQQELTGADVEQSRTLLQKFQALNRRKNDLKRSSS
ncbi:MAG: DNA primase [Oligosphaeraceae bacterium]|nr:DNA primase [Oligosphaeraceae bacterium]